MELRNNSHFLSTYFEIRDVPHFRFEPTKGSIPKNGVTSVKVIFYPRSLGDFSVSAQIIFCDGLAKRVINLHGSAVVNPNPKPIVREPFFMKEENLRFSLLHPNPQYQYTLDEAQAKIQRRQEFDSYISKDR
jgi:hypothetical protein